MGAGRARHEARHEALSTRPGTARAREGVYKSSFIQPELLSTLRGYIHIDAIKDWRMAMGAVDVQGL